ncbi:glycogenin-2 isoform X1 [Varanus komodoensis]|uniref:glycogenin glucosyltransferase n=1 Tax=Varanus komodoensis TaxID=61221 RepID=A0A8D2Q1C9_VARKO|nr:glycogenin-2 isoform X1 [Varanus komodoensis]XP_044288598.1 glycogenin-2 isoform X1 [Varanus komodoensis]
MPVTDQAFVTLATNDVYCHGALVLGQSLRDHRTSRRLAVIITPQVSSTMRAALSTIFDTVVDVHEIDSNDLVHLALLKRLELGVTFTKLHCWTLTQYSKCVFMDADTLVLCNIDELFDREEFSAAPDPGWPDCFNSGVFVFQPSLKTFNLLLQFANEHGSFDGGDQGLLNSFFNSWATKDINKHLPFIYNLSSSAVYTYAPAFQHFGKDARVVHFLGPAKPWNYKYNPQTRSVVEDGSASVSQSQLSFLELWWMTYSSSVLPLLEKWQKSFESQIQREEPNFSGPESKFEQGAPDISNSLPSSAKAEQISQTAINPLDHTSDKNKAVLCFEDKVADPAESYRNLQSIPQQTVKMDEAAIAVSELSVHAEPEQLSSEDERRKWEEGHIDYLGKDAFENIKRKLDAFLL